MGRLDEIDIWWCLRYPVSWTKTISFLTIIYHKECSSLTCWISLDLLLPLKTSRAGLNWLELTIFFKKKRIWKQAMLARWCSACQIGLPNDAGQVQCADTTSSSQDDRSWSREGRRRWCIIVMEIYYYYYIIIISYLIHPKMIDLDGGREGVVDV